MAASTFYNLLIENPTKNVDLMQSGAQGPLRPGMELHPDRHRRLNIQQFQLDAAMWYGAIKTGPFKDVLLRLFSIFYYAGIIYWDGNSWADWSENPARANVASLLSHGQRVLVQIPTSQKGGDELWPWLTDKKALPGRSGATHGQTS